MEIRYIDKDNIVLAVLESDSVEIFNAQDAGELLMNCRYNDCERVIIKVVNLEPQFFDLKSGLAGDILQKFSTYQGNLAIIGDFSKYESNSLKDFIYESNKIGRINFVCNMDEAVNALLKQ